MYRFIYVSSKEVADWFIAKGFTLIKSDEKNNIYVFENTSEGITDYSNENFVFSNMLTF